MLVLRVQCGTKALLNIPRYHTPNFIQTTPRWCCFGVVWRASLVLFDYIFRLLHQMGCNGLFGAVWDEFGCDREQFHLVVIVIVITNS